MQRRSAITLTLFTAAMVAAVAFFALPDGGMLFATLSRPAAALQDPASVTADTSATVEVTPAPPEPEIAPPPEPSPVPDQIRLLVVPGHEPDTSGTAFRGVYERDLNLELGEQLYAYLATDERFDPVISRDAAGWNPGIREYIERNSDAIAAWRDDERRAFRERIESGEVDRPRSAVGHNTASETVSRMLYGLTKWSNENDIDLMVHIHFNDERRASASPAGRFSGAAVYVPDPLYRNSAATMPVAESVFARLSFFDPVSDLSGESTGIVHEPRLIAIGMNDTAKSASMLIEYGYIYEPRLVDPALRGPVLKELAYQTYRGLRDTYGESAAEDPAAAYGTTILPNRWPDPSEDGVWTPLDILAAQSVLILRGTFPKEMDGHACARTGVLDPCTEEALSAFRTGWGVVEEGGAAIGPVTAAGLNALFAE